MRVSLYVYTHTNPSLTPTPTPTLPLSLSLWVTRYENVYLCTSVLGGLFDPAEERDLGLVLMGQNHHNIHHLYPQIPFYK